MRETMERNWTDKERDLAARIVQVVWNSEGKPVGRAFIAVQVGLAFQTPSQKRTARAKLHDIMPLVVKIASTAHVGHTILTFPSGMLMFSDNGKATLRQELVRIHQMVTKAVRTNDAFGTMKESGDEALRRIAFRYEARMEMFLELNAEIREAVERYGLLEALELSESGEDFI